MPAKYTYKRGTKVRAMLLRLDLVTMNHLELAAQADSCSREGYVRRILAEHLGTGEMIQPQDSSAARFDRRSRDKRVRRRLDKDDAPRRKSK